MLAHDLEAWRRENHGNSEGETRHVACVGVAYHGSVERRAWA